MAFVSDTRDEMVRIKPNCKFCNKATMSALLRIDGTIYLSGSGKYRLEIATDCASVGRFIVSELHSLYDLKTEISYRRSILHNTQNYQIDVPYQSNIEQSLKDLHLLGDSFNLIPGISKELIKSDCCKKAYLRGLFLGSGFIAEPKNNFHFEIIVSTEKMADETVKLMKQLGINAKSVKRNHRYMIYIKSGKEIYKFLALTGAHDAALNLENTRIYKSIRNDINRSINAELANQNRTADAAYSQLASINKILKKQGMKNLSPALIEFIKLRVENPEASLTQLGKLTNPPLSKSAINHRARRIEEIARNLDIASNSQ